MQVHLRGASPAACAGGVCGGRAGVGVSFTNWVRKGHCKREKRVACMGRRYRVPCGEPSVPAGVSGLWAGTAPSSR